MSENVSRLFNVVRKKFMRFRLDFREDEFWAFNLVTEKLARHYRNNMKNSWCLLKSVCWMWLVQKFRNVGKAFIVYRSNWKSFEFEETCKACEEKSRVVFKIEASSSKNIFVLQRKSLHCLQKKTLFWLKILQVNWTTYKSWLLRISSIFIILVRKLQ